jgi:uncharacterized delta-60 repeat protein
MRGSLLVTFDELVKDRGIDSFSVYVNGVQKDLHFTDVNTYYSTFVNLNDVVSFFVSFSFSSTSPTKPIVNIYRKDFTTDDEGGDKGIKTTEIFPNVTGGSVSYLYQFTATTRPDAYNFHFIVDADTVTCFEIGTGFSPDTTNSSVQLSDGTLVIVGQFTDYNGTTLNRIVGLNLDGTINNSFNYGTGFNGDGASGEKLQSDGKIIVHGRFWTYRGNTSSKIVRINTDGSWDNTYNVGTGFTSGVTYQTIDVDVTAIDIQSDDKVVAAGFFDRYKGVTVPGICRLNTDASLDTTFSGITTAANAVVNDIKIQPDGKILVVGSFTQFNGVSHNRIVRLNSDGSFDSTFSGVTTGFNEEVYELALQPDGKIIVVGIFDFYNGTSRNRIVRLNSNGSLDTSFVVGTGFNSQVRAVALRNDGSVICGGLFTAFSGVTANRIIGLTSNGSVDTSFVYGTGMGTAAGLDVTDIDILSDNTILVMGEFTEYNGVAANRIVRLLNNGALINCP